MSRIIKILIAAILVGGLVFAGVTTYMEHKRIEEDANAALMDMLIEKNEDENANEKITYVDVEEKEEIEKIEKYISWIFLNFPEGSPLPEVTDVDDIGEDYIEHLVYLNRDLVKSDNGEEIDFSEETVRYYSYPELNRVAVELLGKEVHNKLPNQSGDYFMKSTDGFQAAGMCGSETISNHYVIDKIRLASNGLYYVDMYEYTKDFGDISPDTSIEDDGKKINILDANEKRIFDYTLEVLPYSEMDVTVKILDSEGSEVTEEMMKEDVKENLDKFVKRTVVLEYDEELDLIYKKSYSLEK